MKPLIIFAHYLFIVFVVGIFSCKKELSSSSENNIPPVANAGSDQTTILPKDSVVLDASGSKDPDGIISTYQWTKIDGPPLFTIVNAGSSSTIVRSLVQGVYQFELNVTDNQGANAKDTVQITVTPGNGNNQPPVANAGFDEIISLPTNFCTLDGKSSYDPDGSINAYQWTKIAGPSSFIIQNHAVVETMVNNLDVGIYRFELMVIDNNGLSAKDTVQVTVYPIGTAACDISNRPQINATLTEIGTLSFPQAPYVASGGSKIVFAGGTPDHTVVDIYDVNTHTWSTAQLSQARTNMAVVSCGNKIFFAGGNNYNDEWFDIVDIYDVLNGTWTVSHLSEPKSFSTAAAVGDKVFFAGGMTEYGLNQTNKVDIYDISDNEWSIAALHEPKFNLSAVTAGNKIYFAGGLNYLSGFSEDPYLKSVDIYDASSNTWSNTDLRSLSGSVSGVVLGDNIYWGGIAWPFQEGKTEIWNTQNGTVTTSCLSYSRPLPTAVVKNDNIVFFNAGVSTFNEALSNKFDIYNLETNKWSIGVLNYAIRKAAVISVNNTIYIGGGELSNISRTDKVYILSW